MPLYEFKEDDAFRFASDQGIEAFPKGDELRFKWCPYCKQERKRGDKDTFAINLKTGQFKCMRESCGAKGNMITLAKDFGFSLGNDFDEYWNRNKKYKPFGRVPKREPKPYAVEFLGKRGIGEDIVRKYGITVRDDRPETLVFPFYDDKGQLTFIKYRNTNEESIDKYGKEYCDPDRKPILFGMDACNPADKTLVLTEGQIDSLSVVEAGINNAVSVPTGARGFTWVPYCWDWLHQFETLVIFGDHEKGHITLLEEMKIRFDGTLKHVREEDYLGCKDANELLQKHGRDAVRKAVENAVPVENIRIKKLADVVRQDMDGMPKIDTGLPALNKTIGGLFLGQLVLLTGERGLGKSTLASQFGVFAINQGFPTLFYSGELMDWYFQGWFERQVAGDKNINKLQSNLGYVSYNVRGDRIDQIQDWYSEYAYIYDNTIVDKEKGEEETLLQTLETAIKQYGCKVLIIDNLMTAMQDDIGSDLYRQQTQFVQSLAWMAKKFRVLIILIAHPRKRQAGMPDFGNDDIAGSSNITNLCDVVMRYTLPKKQNGEDDETYRKKRVLQVLKNRLGGRVNYDGIPLHFQDSSKRISQSETFDWVLKWETANEEYYEPTFDY